MGDGVFATSWLFLKNTLIVGYGDHGDSLYSHGFQHNMCHGEPPYCPMCWTPCFIYDGVTAATYENVASLVDLTLYRFADAQTS